MHKIKKKRKKRLLVWFSDSFWTYYFRISVKSSEVHIVIIWIGICIVIKKEHNCEMSYVKSSLRTITRQHFSKASVLDSATSEETDFQR